MTTRQVLGVEVGSTLGVYCTAALGMGVPVSAGGMVASGGKVDMQARERSRNIERAMIGRVILFEYIPSLK